jgi:DNA recombination protein RmuC
METILALLVGAALGGTAIWFLRRPQGDGTLQALNADLQTRLAGEQAMTTAERAARGVAEQQAAAAVAEARAVRDEQARMSVKHREDLEGADRRRAADLEALKDTFAKQSTEALRAVAPDMGKQVRAMVDPLMAEIRTSLEGVNSSVGKQGDALAGVRERMENLSKATEALTTETNDFTMVLKSAAHRGRWGEQTLRRVVEAAGMSPHCDFAEQMSQDDKRPDLVVKLPGNRCVIIDSKVPELDAARLASGAPNRAETLKDHAVKMRQTIRALAQKNYPATIGKEQGLAAYDKVILFLPAESLLSTALEADNNLVIEAGEHGILLATPATLIGFLGAINLAWKEQAQAENSREIAAAANLLYERVGIFLKHFARVGKGLDDAAGAFNEAVSSYRKRLRPAGEKLTELGIGGDNPMPEIDTAGDDLEQLPEKES